jgi:hypothetical protein
MPTRGRRRTRAFRSALTHDRSLPHGHITGDLRLRRLRPRRPGWRRLLPIARLQPIRWVGSHPSSSARADALTTSHLLLALLASPPLPRPESAASSLTPSATTRCCPPPPGCGRAPLGSASAARHARLRARAPRAHRIAVRHRPAVGVRRPGLPRIARPPRAVRARAALSSPGRCPPPRPRSDGLVRLVHGNCSRDWTPL